jgi:DNA-binding response OmpR family regulator
MEILIADRDFTSRVPVETYLRDSGHKAVIFENGLDAAKLIASGKGPTIAIMSNDLDKLRGIDICRFLSAMEKKHLVYVILLIDEADPKLLPKLRQAGIEDILIRPVEQLDLAVALDNAILQMSMRDELMLHRRKLASIGGEVSVLEKRSHELKEKNLELLKNWAGSTDKKPSQEMRNKAVKPSGDEPRKMVLFSADDPNASIYKKEDAVKASTDGESSFDPESVIVDKPNSGSDGVSEQEALEVVEDFKIAEMEEEMDDMLILPFEFDDLVVNVFSGMGVTLKPEIPAITIGARESVMHTWMCLGIPTRGSWLDLFFECSEEAAKAVTGAILDEDNPGADEQKEMLSELMNMLQGSLKSHFEEKKVQCSQLSIPASRPSEKPVDIDEEKLLVDSGFSINGHAVNVYLFDSKSPEMVDDLANLKVNDFICDDVVEEAGDPVGALRNGLMVKPKHISDYGAGLAPKIKPFRVAKPSVMAERIGLFES